MSDEIENELTEFAEEEASEVVTCVMDHRRQAPSCSWCKDNGFCQKVYDKLKEIEGRAEA